MKKHGKEIVIVMLQFIVFYLFPLFAGPAEVIGLLFLILISTFTLSVILGYESFKKVKFFYPIFIVFLFLPTVFIYYTQSAVINSVWYLVTSIIGILLGHGIRKIEINKDHKSF